MSLRDKILSNNDARKEAMYIKEWEETIYVKALNAREREKFEKCIIEIRGTGKGAYVVPKDNIMAILVSMAVVDEDGEQVFEAADVDSLGNKSASAISRIFEMAQVLAGLKEGDIEELAGNFN